MRFYVKEIRHIKMQDEVTEDFDNAIDTYDKADAMSSFFYSQIEMMFLELAFPFSKPKILKAI